MNVSAGDQFPGLMFLAMALLFISGCNPSPVDDSTAGAMSAASQLAIKEAVLRDLLDFQDVRLHPIRASTSAYVIDDPVDGKKLAEAFAGHVPPVTTAATTLNDDAETLDAATGKPVEIYSVRIREISCNHARVGAGWHSAPLTGIWYSYELKRVNGVWKVTGKVVVGVT